MGEPIKITEKDLKDLPERDAIEIVKKAYGAMNDVEARFMLGIMDGFTRWLTRSFYREAGKTPSA